ncbi:MAG TPA: Gfo/Idh/MocA family oxidoreductase [Candidatus Acidoferrum sp.]|nr:Gfo/Idh/MocA family oxidoreductase [Candidatus Acidoferrum sp.]
MQPVNWGIISTALIGTAKVIPAMQKSKHCRIQAIASRDLALAKKWAAKLGIPKAYGSYEELLADREIEAVYNPLPNHLHVPWSIKAAEAGKHVLCEKPIALDAKEAEQLVAARNRTGKLITEAFMVRSHPQWLRTRELVRQGKIGELRTVQGLFTYFLTDPKNVRNMADIGGGGLYDIGCYPIVTSRFLFEAEPTRVVGLVEYDPVMKIDRLASAILDYPKGQASFTCATQLAPYQRMQILGTKGRIEVEIPFNAPPDKPCRIFIDDGSELGDASAKEETFPVCDQYAIQGDLFSEAIRSGKPVEFPLENAVQNMRVIDAIFRSAKTGGWEKV